MKFGMPRWRFSIWSRKLYQLSWPSGATRTSSGFGSDMTGTGAGVELLAYGFGLGISRRLVGVGLLIRKLLVEPVMFRDVIEGAAMTVSGVCHDAPVSILTAAGKMGSGKLSIACITS